MEYPRNAKDLLVQQADEICAIFGLTKEEAVWRASKAALYAQTQLASNLQNQQSVVKEEPKESPKEKESPEKVCLVCRYVCCY